MDIPPPDPDEAGPYTLIVTMRAKPGGAERLERRLLELVAPTRQEAGSLAYHVHRDRADPGRFVLYEAWSSIEALKAHLSQPHLVAFIADRDGFLDGADINWLRMASSYQ